MNFVPSSISLQLDNLSSLPIFSNRGVGLHVGGPIHFDVLALLRSHISAEFRVALTWPNR